MVPASEAGNFRVYGSRFVDEIKNAGQPNAYEKSRLVIQAFGYKDHGLMTYAPTTQRASQRLLLAICAMDTSLQFFTRDISQAYVQAATKVEREIFVRPPAEMNLGQQCLLRVERPLYGLPESGLHWFRTYHKHHTVVLGMTASVHDPCLLCFPSKLFSSLPMHYVMHLHLTWFMWFRI